MYIYNLWFMILNLFSYLLWYYLLQHEYENGAGVGLSRFHSADKMAPDWDNITVVKNTDITDKKIIYEDAGYE